MRDRMTFVGGNRSCIGFKFAQIEMSASPSTPSVQPRTLTPARRGRPRGAPRQLRLRARPRAPHLLERLRDRLPERGQGERQARDVAQGQQMSFRRRVGMYVRVVYVAILGDVFYIPRSVWLVSIIILSQFSLKVYHR